MMNVDRITPLTVFPESCFSPYAPHGLAGRVAHQGISERVVLAELSELRRVVR
jgi:hypothetical protein